MRDSWGEVPAPFNNEYDPLSHARYEATTNSMEADNFYTNHTREECAKEWRKRYETLKENDHARS